MTRRRILGLLAAASVLLTLTACVDARALPPQPTRAELEPLDAIVRDMQWRFLELTPSATRPEVTFERYVSPSETRDVYLECMREAGFVAQGAPTISGLTDPSERVGLYVCISRFPLNPVYYNLYTNPQLEVIYNYYRDELVPCLRGAGLPLTDVPSRAEFLEPPVMYLGHWTPWSALVGLTDVEAAALAVQCPDESRALVGARE